MHKEPLMDQEHPSTYLVQNRSLLEEQERLRIQDALLTEGMGGVLAEQEEPSRFPRVLDVGCGTGGWLIALAQAYPSIERLVGVDISASILNFARQQAEDAGVGERVRFHVMDALRMLEFPDRSFDLVNQRAGMSFLRRWEWPKLLQEYRRVLRVDGLVRVTEGEICPQTSSAALTELCDLLVDALYQAGHLETPTSDGITRRLATLVRRYGFQDVQSRVATLSYDATSQGFFDDVRLGFRTLAPFLHKWIKVPDSYDETYQQALAEMQQEDFSGTGKLLTVWGAPDLSGGSR